MSAIKRLKKEVSKELSVVLEHLHPDLFGRRIKPWKVGIHKDLMSRYRLLICEMVQKRHPDMSDTDAELIGIRALEAVLHRLSSHPRYSFAVLCNKFRYDLDGQACGEITKHDKRFHRQKIKGRKRNPRMRKSRYMRRSVA